MLLTRKLGSKQLRMYADSRGSAHTWAKLLYTGNLVRTIGPRDETEGRASIVLEYKSKTDRDAAIVVANNVTADQLDPPRKTAVQAAAETEGVTDTMASTKSAKRPSRKATASKKDAAKKGAAKKGAAKKGAVKKGAAKKGAAKKGAAKKGRPAGRKGVGTLVKGMIKAKKSDEAIITAVKKEFPDSAFNEKHKQHLPWYRHQVSKAE